jgi:hypothetical protein
VTYGTNQACQYPFQRVEMVEGHVDSSCNQNWKNIFFTQRKSSVKQKTFFTMRRSS